jgi:hypothetical protein
MRYIVARLREPSTWAGLAVLCGTLGVVMPPDTWQAITTAGMAVAGLVAGLMADRPPA